MPESIYVFQKTARNIQISISREPVELFRRLKKQIKALSMPNPMMCIFVTIRAMEMVEIAFKMVFRK